MKKFVSLIILMLLLTMCRENPTSMSKKNLIDQEKFTNILVDMHMMEGIINTSDFYRRYTEGDSVNIYDELYKKYGVTQADFDSTVVAYTRRPDLYMKVYDDVILRLNLKLDLVRKKEPSFEKEVE
jgi:hypothetical protein